MHVMFDKSVTRMEINVWFNVEIGISDMLKDTHEV